VKLGYKQIFTAGLIALLLPLQGAIAVGTTSGDIRISVRQSPQQVKENGQYHLVYEVHIENKGSSPVIPVRVASYRRVLEKAMPVVSYTGDELLSNTEFFDSNYRGAGREYLRDANDNPSSIGANMVGVVYLWLTFNNPLTLPSNFYHDVVLREVTTGGEIAITGAEFTASQSEPLVIGPPVEGGPWWSLETMDNNAVHRRAMVLSMPHISQRYAVDLVKLGNSGTSFEGPDLTNQDKWYGYNAKVIAVADGIVIDVADGVPENVPGSTERVVPMTADTINGNFVVLDIGEGKFAHYGHLVPGSIGVTLGQSVKRGDVLAGLGNSGNSDAPHLHFHINSEQHLFDAEGFPYVYEAFEHHSTISVKEIQAGKKYRANTRKSEIRHFEIPSDNSVITFPEIRSKLGAALE